MTVPSVIKPDVSMLYTHQKKAMASLTYDSIFCRFPWRRRVNEPKVGRVSNLKFRILEELGCHGPTAVLD